MAASQLRRLLESEEGQTQVLLILDWKLDQVLRLLRRVLNMARVTQGDLDNIAVQLVGSEGRIATELKRLQDANPDLDLSGVNDAVAGIANLVPSAVTPGTPPVAADPATPVTPDPSSDDAGGDSVTTPPTSDSAGPLDPDAPAVADAPVGDDGSSTTS